MPRSRSPTSIEAEELYRQGMPLVKIAEKLDVPASTVRRWKSTQNWEDGSKGDNKKTTSKKNERSDSKKRTGKTNVRKRKRGAQPGNQNAKGGRGNPNPKPPVKHGVYSLCRRWDFLDEEEKEIFKGVLGDADDEEQILIEDIAAYTIRERKIMMAIKKQREMKGDIYTQMTSVTQQKRKFKDKEEEAEYERRIKEKVDSGERLPGETYQTFTQTGSTHDLIARWEREMTTVQRARVEAIDKLAKIRFEKQRMQKQQSQDNDGNMAVNIINDIPKATVTVNTNTAVFNPLQKYENGDKDSEVDDGSD